MGLYQSTTRTFDLSPNGKWVIVSPEMICVAVRAIRCIELVRYEEAGGCAAGGLYTIKLTSQVRYEKTLETLVSKPMPLTMAKACIMRLTGGRDDTHEHSA
jgi:hypothetical protein